MASKDTAKASTDTDGTDPNADVAELSYEAARDELATIVATMEAGTVGLEESMTLWQRGEALAAHCGTWLDRAEAVVREKTEQTPEE